MEIDVSGLKFYAVRNKEGKWFRSKGYGGYGSNWVDSLLKARIYNKTAGARTVIGYYANNFKQYGIPDLVEFSIGEVNIIDETLRRQKLAEKKAISDAKNKEREAKEDMERAHHELANAKEKLRVATEKVNGYSTYRRN